MTQFIESVSTHQLLPPYHCENAQVHCFLFEIGVQAIQRFCDTFLNLGDQDQRPFVYKPIAEAPFGLLTVTQYPALCSLDTRMAQAHGIHTEEWDHLKQTECYVAVPVHRFTVTGANLMVDPVIQWVQPIIVVDNATSAFSGREILGLDTLYGEIAVQRPAKEGGFSFKVSLPSWMIFLPNSPQGMLPFVTIDGGPPVADASARNAVDEAALRELESAIPDLAGILEGRFPESLELVILKQFRSAADATQAIYQALITCENRFSNVTGISLFDPTDLTIDFQNGAMVQEILDSFLDLPRTTGMVVRKPTDKSPKPYYRRASVGMAMRFTATIDLMGMKSQFNFRRPGV